MVQVEINQNTHFLLSSFALSCQEEEVAALLLGKLADDKVFVERACLLPRRQRKKDRVEVGNEDLSRAMQMAESLGLVVVGWYHTHPKIVILPSQVDLKTQLQLQMLEKSFVGLIYACYHENQNGSQRLQVIAFQAQESPEGIKRIDIRLDVELRSQISNNISAGEAKIVKTESSVSKEKFKNDMIRDSHLIDIANTFLQEELIGGEPKSGVEAVMSAARIAKIKSSLIDPLKML
jgi:proteasome lid subunit RPN8/RPN11